MAFFEKKQPQKPQEIVKTPPKIQDDLARRSLHEESKKSEALTRLIAQAQVSQSITKTAEQSAAEPPVQNTENTREESADSEDVEIDTSKLRANRKRTKQILVRLSPDEQQKLLQRVAKTGLTQSEFVRQAALTSRIVMPKNTELLVSIEDQLAALCAEIGRQGGMLKMVIKPNKGMRELHPDEWEELTSAIRKLKYAQRDINTMREELKNGNDEAQNK